MVLRTYSYDALGRPLTCNTARNGQTVNDSFVHNSRSELASAQVNGESYGYDYDNIGNRRMAMESGDYSIYEANSLNQYTAITGSENEEEFSFTPTFDADGNQTTIKTETGIWTAVYNAENRPVSFTNEATGTVVTCAYDSMGRRSFKKVTTNGSVTLHQRYLYRGYLQIACIDLTRSHHPALWYITWDPTQTTKTRPLAIQISGTWHTYGWDLAKNVCEVFGSTGYILTAYTYTPNGFVSSTGETTQPIMWSSEFFDSETTLSYYNYRNYNSLTRQWISRDPLGEKYNYNLYQLGTPIGLSDFLGLVYGIKYLYEDGTLGHAWIVLGREQPHSEIINNPTTGETISLFIPVAYGFGPGINDIVTALLTLLLIPVPGDKRTNEDRKYKALFDFAKAKNGYMPITTVKEYDTYILKEKGAVLKYGDNLDKYGKPVCCKKISSDDFSTKDYGRIKLCIAKHKFSSIYNGFYRNCRQVARDVLHDCCLRTTFEDNVPGKQPAPLRYTV